MTDQTNSVDPNQPLSATNNPLAGKTPEEINLHFDALKNTLVDSVASTINSTLAEGATAFNKIGAMSKTIHSVVDGLASELAVFHQFEHAIRTGADDLGSMWTIAEQKLDSIRQAAKDKAQEIVDGLQQNSQN